MGSSVSSMNEICALLVQVHGANQEALWSDLAMPFVNWGSMRTQLKIRSAASRPAGTLGLLAQQLLGH